MKWESIRQAGRPWCDGRRPACRRVGYRARRKGGWNLVGPEERTPGGETPPSTAGGTPAATGARFKKGSGVVCLEHPGEQQEFGVGGRELRQDQTDTGTIGGQGVAQALEVFDLVPLELLKVEHELGTALGQ